MKKLLSKLPHIHSKSNSDQRPSSESKKPIKRASLRTPVHRDANNDTNGPSKIVHTKDSTPSKQTSELRGHEQRASPVVTTHHPVGSPPQSKSETSESNINKSGRGLHLAPQDTSLSDALGHLTLGGGSKDAIDPSRTRYSEDVADRNVMANEKGPLPAENSTHEERISIRSPGQVDEFSEDIADRNMGTNTSPNARSDSQKASTSAVSSPRNPKSNQHPIGLHVDPDRRVPENVDLSSSSSEYSVITRPQPGVETNHDSFRPNSESHVPKSSIGAAKTEYKDLDFTNSTSTDVQTQYAPAVTHETVIPEVRHVEEKVVTREIHNHDVYHRILPIRDVEILPAKHFVHDPSTGNLTEIPAPPGGEGEDQRWKIVPTEHGHSGWQPTAPRPFTARTFEGDEGITREYVGEDGVPRTEMTWIHPPTVQDGGRKTGQTEALFLDELNEPDGEGRSKDIPSAWSDGVHGHDSQFSNGYNDGHDMEKQVRRRPVGGDAEP